MKIWMNVIVTNYGMRDRKFATVYVDVNDGEIKDKYTVSFQDGMKILARMSKKLGKLPKFTTNAYDPKICYHELFGRVQ